jgi:hypothetical protein
MISGYPHRAEGMLRHLARVQDMILVECLDELANLAKSSILQHDGFQGHQIVGEAIAQAVILDGCSRDVRPAIDPVRLQPRNCLRRKIEWLTGSPRATSDGRLVS